MPSCMRAPYASAAHAPWRRRRLRRIVERVPEALEPNGSKTSPDRGRSTTYVSALAALGEVLRNRGDSPDRDRLDGGTAADWAFLVVLLVVVYDAGGAFAAGLLGAVRVVPAIIAAPFATTLVERFRGDRVLTGINLVRCAGAIATALVVAADMPIEVTYVLAGGRRRRGIAGETDTDRPLARLRADAARARGGERRLEHG